MFALGVCLMATVSSVGPTTATPMHASHGDSGLARAVVAVDGSAAPTAVASTYDDAACDLSDSGECAPSELAIDFGFGLDLTAPAAAPDLDCKDPRVGDPPRFGSCDLPRPVSPRARLAWLRGTGHGSARHAFSAASRASTPVTSPPRLDDSHTLLVSIPTALLIPSTFPIHIVVPAQPKAAPRDRLERPPRV
jgi:hypothetical protein